MSCWICHEQKSLFEIRCSTEQAAARFAETALMTDASNKVIALREAHLDFPCVEARKLRAVDERGHQHFDRWCIKHHHWLNDAPPCDDVLTAELKALRSQGLLRMKSEYRS
jgi:hypothetical protein